MAEEQEQLIDIAGVYRHFKGDYYYVMGTAIDKTNNYEEPVVVIYRKLFSLALYIRPHSQFFEMIRLPSGAEVCRFSRLPDDEVEIILKKERDLAKKHD